MKHEAVFFGIFIKIDASNMKKTLFMLIFMSSMSFFALAQKNTAAHKIGVGIETIVPLKGQNTGLIGGSLQYDYPIAKLASLSFTTGYLYQYIGSLGGGSSQGIIPLKAGGKYNLTPHLYASAQAGVMLATKSYFKNNVFTFSSGLGAAIPIGAKSNINVDVSYVNWKLKYVSPSYFALRAAYAFGL